jgi:hypothetical protein
MKASAPSVGLSGSATSADTAFDHLVTADGVLWYIGREPSAPSASPARAVAAAGATARMNKCLETGAVACEPTDKARPHDSATRRSPSGPSPPGRGRRFLERPSPPAHRSREPAADTLLRLPRIRMRTRVHHPIPVRRPAALISPINEDPVLPSPRGPASEHAAAPTSTIHQ